MTKININNTEKVNQILDLQQKRSRSRTITIETIYYIVQQTEHFLSGILYKKDWNDLIIDIDYHAQKFPSCYRGTPFSTHITLIRKHNKWYLSCVCRNECGKRMIYVNLAGKEEALRVFIENTVKEI